MAVNVCGCLVKIQPIEEGITGKKGERLLFKLFTPRGFSPITPLHKLNQTGLDLVTVQ